MLLIYVFTILDFVFPCLLAVEIRSEYVTLAVLELEMCIRLASYSQRYTCLYLLGYHAHSWPLGYSLFVTEVGAALRNCHVSEDDLKLFLAMPSPTLGLGVCATTPSHRSVPLVVILECSPAYILKCGL